MKIWLVWATNVGKSTLFNRLIRQFRAIVTDIAGTTIDILQHTSQVTWLWEVTFSDSPWLSSFQEERPFIQKLIKESDIILFVIDDSIGMSAKEKQIFKYILEQWKKKNTILVINKLDIKRKIQEYDIAISNYYKLGFEDVVGISAHKQNQIEILENKIKEKAKTLDKTINTKDKTNNEDKEKNETIHLAIVWKPNVWKSTLLNTLTKEYMAKTEDKAGTTRDYIMWEFLYNKQKYKIYDTAGIKKKWKMQELEKIAYQKTLKMLEYIRPLVIFMIDASQWISHRDMSLVEETNNLKLPIIVCLNKTDLLNESQLKETISSTQKHLDFAKYIPIVPLIATTWDWIDKIFRMLKSIRKESHKRISTNKLNEAFTKDRITRPPRFPKNKICKIMYATQIEIHAPAFMIFINHKKRANFAFKRRIENTIRQHFWFIWTPLKIVFKERVQKKHSEHEEKNTPYK